MEVEESGVQSSVLQDLRITKLLLLGKKNSFEMYLSFPSPYSHLLKERLKCLKARDKQKLKHIDNIQAQQSTHE